MTSLSKPLISFSSSTSDAAWPPARASAWQAGLAAVGGWLRSRAATSGSRDSCFESWWRAWGRSAPPPGSEAIVGLCDSGSGRVLRPFEPPHFAVAPPVTPNVNRCTPLPPQLQWVISRGWAGLDMSYAQPAATPGLRSRLVDQFPVHQHEAVRSPHLVRMKARCDRDLSDDTGARGSLTSAMLVPTPGSIWPI
jgi:hypothetical protein